MATTNLHVLLEMSDEPDCRFVATWLIKVAEAQALWSQALNDDRFADHVLLLHADGIPDLAAATLEILGELEHNCHVAVLDVYQDESGLFSREFSLLERLGFFVLANQSYRLNVPEAITLASVKQAALDMLSTAEDCGDGIDVLRPERHLHTLTALEAEAWRLTVMAMRRVRASADRRRSVQ